MLRQRRCCVAQHRVESAAQRGIGQNAVQVHRCLGRLDDVPLGGNGAMEISQRLRIVQRRDFGQYLAQQIVRPVGFGPEGCQFIAPVSLALVVRSLDEDALGTGDIVHRRHEQQSQIVSRLEMRARGPFPCVRHGAAAFKLGTTFLVHQPGSIVREVRHGISRRPKPLRFKECRPS